MKRVLVASLLFVAACEQPLPTQPSEELPSGTVRAEFRAVQLDDKESTPVSGALDLAAVDYVGARRSVLGLSDADDMVVLSAPKTSGTLSHVRLQQQYLGVPVWGSDVVVHASGSTFKSLSGGLTVGLKGFRVNPSITEDEALFSAKADYAALAKSMPSELVYERESSELVIYPGESGVRLAFHVTFFTELQNDVNPGLWNYFVDAKTGAFLAKFNGIHTLSQASGPGGNAKVARTWSSALDVELSSGTTYKMDTARLLTVNMANSQSGSGTTVTGPLSNIGDAAINDAHGFAEGTLNMLTDWFGYNSINGTGFKVRSRVHYGTNYENAFWDGTQMTYGDGASTFYPLSGDVDVVSHEIHHGFTTFHSNLTYSGQSGGINESFSDVAGTAAEFYMEGTGADWDLGRDIFKSNGALRYMCDPTLDGASIGHASNYTNGMDVHYSSGLFNKAFCRAARRLSSSSPTGAASVDGVKRTAKVWFEANDNYWTASTTFVQGCQGVVDAATALGYAAGDVTAIRDSFADVGVICAGATEPAPACDETLTGTSGTLSSANPYANSFARTWCIQPSNGAAATLTFSAFSTEANYDFVEIRNANTAVLSKTSGTTAPAAATSTKLYVKFTTDGSQTSTGWTASWTTGGSTNQAPQVSLTSPANGSTLTGSVTVSATASDADGSVAKVTFGLPDGTSVDDTTSPYLITWNSASVADGSNYSITAKSFDNLGAASGLASRTVNVSNGTTCANGTYAASGLPVSIPDNNTTGVTSTINVTGGGTVSALALSLNITHTYRGDLIVSLVGPDGTSVVVSNKAGGSADNLVLANSAVTAFNGKTAAGAWKLKAVDSAAQDVGSIGSWSLAVTGNCGNPPPPTANWTASGSPNLATVDNGQACTTLTVSGTGNAADVKLDVGGTHAYRSVLRATLEHGGVTKDAFPTATFATGSGAFSLTGRAVAGFTGSATGTWTLCIVDTDAYGDAGTLATWSIHN